VLEGGGEDAWDGKAGVEIEMRGNGRVKGHCTRSGKAKKETTDRRKGSAVFSRNLARRKREFGREKKEVGGYGERLNHGI